jgi:hypothetical protein
MPEYIEREAAIKSLVGWETEPTDEEIEYTLKKIPAADVVEVVRCEDCKHSYINAFSAQSGVVLCRFLTNQSEGAIQTMPQDGFCSYG